MTAKQTDKQVTTRVVYQEIHFRVRSIINTLGNLNSKYLKKSLIIPKISGFEQFH